MKPMKFYIFDLVIFVLFWAITDRIREIAVFANWKSIFGGWFDRYFTPEYPTWFFLRDGYHTFKLLPILLLTYYTWTRYDWFYALVVAATWGAGQAIGLLFRKEE